MASVRLDSIHDPRFKILGKYLGTSAFDALGRMAFVYEYCTDKGAHTISPDILDALTDYENFGVILIDADLGELAQDGMSIRIKGTEGRIEWLSKRRAAARKGGEANRANFEAKESQEIGTNEPNESQTEAKSEPNGSPKSKAKAIKEYTNLDLHRGALDFEALYKKYPKKAGKVDGLLECKKQIKTLEEYARLDQAILRYGAYVSRTPREGEFIPSPKDFSTFMRKGRWRECLEADYGESAIPIAQTVKPHSMPPGQYVPDAERTRKMLEESIEIAAEMPLATASFLATLKSGAQ